MQRPAVVRGLARRALVPALACAAILAAGIALAAGVSALRSEESPPASSQPVELSATVGPTTHLFADELTGRVVVRVDRRVVDPNSVRVDATFRPYGVIEPPRVTTTTAGDLVTREYRFRVFCLRADCRPKGTERRRVVLAPVRVVLRQTDGSIRGTSLALPPVEVATRLTPQDRLRPALDVGDEPLPAVTYRAEPDRAALVLGLAAALLALLGLVLLLREARRAVLLARERRRRPPTRLERALGLVRRAEHDGDERDRRLALDALASALDPRDGSLASATRNAAWAPGGPAAGDLRRLADAAERTAGAEA
jgi:hypothetical protein